MEQNGRQGSSRDRAFAWLVSGISVLLIASGSARAAEEGAAESCVRCHSNADFLVTDKKLYDYFQDWKSSIHGQEGVTCADCHGGNVEGVTKEEAHGKEVSGGSVEGSAVSFRNVPETCGTCHESIYQAYQESDHFDHLLRKKQDKQGPNCVTCHGSINVEVLNVNTVSETCAQCHNDETENHPDTPEKAQKILNRFLSIHRFYRYIGIRASGDEASAFFETADARIEKLSEAWHSFDLPKIERETSELLEFMKARRAELRDANQKAH